MRASWSGFLKCGVVRLWPSGRFWCALPFALLAVASGPAFASEQDPKSNEALAEANKALADKGQVIVSQFCDRCHAIGKTGASPNAEAPPFRTLSESYPVEDLAESLAEGIMSGHPDMPVFVFGPKDVDAIIVYLQSIQVAPDTPGASAPADAEG